MSASPLLSIGMPVLNGERYLAEAIESALSQDYERVELLISDNGSTDGTEAICRRYESDARVRYSRSPETIEAVANFRRVLEMARGEYFTWLAHDDVLTSPGYASTMVAALERDPAAVLCASELRLFDEDPGTSAATLRYEFTTEPRWRSARRALFRWPPAEWETLIYGTFRHDALRRQVESDPTLRFALQRLAFAGRFIVVPSPLRGYRLHEDSLGRRRVAKSELELVGTGVALKLQLLGVAAGSRAPLTERLRLSLVALRNLTRDHVRWAHSVRRQIRDLERELDVLLAAAEERSRATGGRPDAIHALRPTARPALSRFRRPRREHLDYLADLSSRVAEARETCDRLLAAIESRRDRN